jgi:hypothetical protein
MFFGLVYNLVLQQEFMRRCRWEGWAICNNWRILRNGWCQMYVGTQPPCKLKGQITSKAPRELSGVGIPGRVYAWWNVDFRGTANENRILTFASILKTIAGARFNDRWGALYLECDCRGCRSSIMAPACQGSLLISLVFGSNGSFIKSAWRRPCPLGGVGF